MCLRTSFSSTAGGLTKGGSSTAGGLTKGGFFGWRLGGRLIKGSWGTSFNNLDDVFDGFEIDPRHPDAIQSYGT